MIHETRRRLKEWGRWARGGFPTVGSMFRALFGDRSSTHEEMPREVQEIDIIVCRCPADHRIILIRHYSNGGSIRQVARELGLSHVTLWRRLERAEYHVNAALDGYETETL